MPFVSRRPQLQLSSKELEALNKISHSRTEGLSRVERAKMLLAYYDGKSVSSIAKVFDTNRPKVERDRKSTRLNSSHTDISRMPSSA